MGAAAFVVGTVSTGDLRAGFVAAGAAVIVPLGLELGIRACMERRRHRHADVVERALDTYLEVRRSSGDAREVFDEAGRTIQPMLKGLPRKHRARLESAFLPFDGEPRPDPDSPHDPELAGHVLLLQQTLRDVMVELRR